MNKKTTIEIETSRGLKIKVKMSKEQNLNELREKLMKNGILKLNDDDIFVEDDGAEILKEDEVEYTIEDFSPSFKIKVKEFYFLIYVDNVLQTEEGKKEGKKYFVNKKENLSILKSKLDKPICDNKYIFIDKERKIIENNNLEGFILNDILSEDTNKNKCIYMKKIILNEKEKEIQQPKEQNKEISKAEKEIFDRALCQYDLASGDVYLVVIFLNNYSQAYRVYVKINSVSTNGGFNYYYSDITAWNRNY